MSFFTECALLIFLGWWLFSVSWRFFGHRKQFANYSITVYKQRKYAL